MKKYILAVVIIGLLTNCDMTGKSGQSISTNKMAKNNKQIDWNLSSEGYVLMKQNCFVCHFEKMDRSKRSSMVAPPMERVQEHYRASFPDKKSFVSAIKNWVKSPSEKKLLMPGAARKFGQMPMLSLTNQKLEKIARTLYDMNFDQPTHRRKMFRKKIGLNNGKKWKLKQVSVRKLQQSIQNLETLDSRNISDYRQQAKDIFNAAKIFLLDKSYDENTLQQIQVFFHDIEEDMHRLMAVENLPDAKKYQKVLLQKLDVFNRYFE